jgi:hypothetical protein
MALLQLANMPLPGLAKRDRLAIWAGRMSITALLGALPKQSILSVLNYHRIGNPDEARHDSGILFASPEDLDDQIRVSEETLVGRQS